MINTKFITNKKGKQKEVILGIKTFDKIIEKLEDLEDIKLAYKSNSEKGPSIPFDDYLQEFAARSARIQNRTTPISYKTA